MSKPLLTTKAAVYTSYGRGDEVISIKDIPIPEVGKKEVLIRVEACALNPVDWKMAQGWLKIIQRGRTHRVGFDFAGTVEKTGAECTRLKKGDKVFGMCHYMKVGSCAELVAVREDVAVKAPTSVTIAEASSLPLVSLTSLQALRTGGVKHGSKVLILGVSGGTGFVGAQIAKLLGAKLVVGVCSAKNAEFAKQCGVDIVVDYTTHNWWESLPAQGMDDFDCVYDCVGGAINWKRAHSLLKKGKKYVSIVGDNEGGITVRNVTLAAFASINRLFWSFICGPTYRSVRCDATNVDDLTLISNWVNDGKLKPEVQKVYPFTTAGVQTAFTALMSNRTRGKLVIEM